MTTRIIRIALRLSNAYVLQGERGAILVDTGIRGESAKILRAIEVAGVRRTEITLIAHTHSHSDHAGSTAELAGILSVPTALHAADRAMAQRGNNGTVRTRGLSGKIVLPFVDLPFAPYTPDVLLEDGANLTQYGVDAVVRHTPGHTLGSVSFVSAAGIIAGDVLMGGYIGGHLLPERPGYHYFAESTHQVDASIRALLSLSNTLIYVGHGGPLQRAAVAAWFSRAHARAPMPA
jgi:hydroxyacylglutathione hydrolase